MKLLNLMNPFTEHDTTILLDDDTYEWLKDQIIHWNQHGYPMIEYEGKTRPMHVAIYHKKKGIFSKQYVTGLHHKNEDKLDNRIDNLELVDWNWHRQEHDKNRVFSPEPQPQYLEIR